MMMLSGIERKTAIELAHKKLSELHMLNLQHKNPNGFSSGQKKKILLAQALIHNPDIMIMDEPVANLDPEARSEFFALLDKLKKAGKAIFVSSHVLAELDLYFDSATILDGGKIIFSGTKQQLFKKIGHANYIIDTTNNPLLLAYLKKQHIKHKVETQHIIVDTANEKIIKDMQAYLVKQGVIIKTFNLNNISLEQVYQKMVIKGSVDTM
jgi:ABC-2 type transport system ATP-binding protein